MKRLISAAISMVMAVTLVFTSVIPANGAMLSSQREPDFSSLTQKELQRRGYRVPGTEEAKKEKGKEERKARRIDQGIDNEYIEVNIENEGVYTMGTVEGNPNYTSDNNRRLLYGHPGNSTSETLIKIDDSELFFEADTINIDHENGKIYAYMTISEYGVQVIQTLEFVKSSDGIYNTVQIGYQAINTDNTPHNVGIRIMIDTMVASNDHAPFKVSGIGNVKTRRGFQGSSVPKTYQVYDDLDNPTTIGTGIVYGDGEKKPDRVLFTNWGNASGSDWDYDHGEGDSLGDSAVVFYYNPVSLGRGASRFVSTYYGTSIGTSLGGDSDITIGGDQIGIRVKERFSGEGLRNATVTVKNTKTGESREAKTDDIGLAVFDDIEKLVGSCKIKVTKDNYQTEELQKTLKEKQLAVVLLKGNGDDVPAITEATWDNISVMPGDSKVTYCENKDGVKATASNSKAVRLSVKADETGCVYRLIQNGSVVKTSSDGKFTFTVLTKDNNGKNYSVPRIDGLKSGQAVYVQAVGQDGSKSNKKLLGVQIKEPSSGKLDSSKTSVSIGSKVSVNLNGDKMNPVEKFFLGDSEISLGSEAFPAYVEVEETGKVKIGINKPGNQSFAEYKEDFLRNMKNAQTRKQALQSFGAKSIRVGGVEPLEWHIAGYGEGIVKDGKATIDVDVYAYLKKGASWTTYWFVLSCPIYVKTGIEGKLQGEMAVRANYDDGWMFSFTKGDINPSVKGSVEVGAGVSGALSIGIEGSGDIAFLYRLPNDYYKLSTTLECGIKAKAFLLEYNKTWASYTKVWKDGYARSAGARVAAVQKEDQSFDESELYEFERYQQIPRTYLISNKKQARMKRKLLRFDTDAVTIKSNAFTNAQPQYVEAGGNQYCFFLEDANGVEEVPDRTESDRTVLVYSQFDPANQTWSEPKPIDDDGTADFNFDVIGQGEQIYIVWQNISKTFGDQEASVEDYYRLSDIKSVKLDCTTHTVTEYTVPSTDHPDSLPKIGTNGSEVSIAWYESKSNEITSTEPSNYIIHGAKLTDEQFVEYVNQTIEAGSINGLDLGYVNDEAVISYVLDLNQNASDAEDTELYYIKGNTNTRMTNNEVVDSQPIFVRENGKDILYWYQDGSFASSDNLEAISLIGEKEGTSFTDDFTVLTNSDGSRKKIVWSRFSENYAENLKNKAIYAIDYHNGSWSDPYELNGLGEGVVSSLSGYLDEDGKEHIVVQKVEYYENSGGAGDGQGEENISEVTASNIYYLTAQARTSVRVDSVVYDSNNAASGSTLPITVGVTNTGNQKISSLTFSIGNDKIEAAVNLMPGESAEVELTNYTVPNINEAITYSLEIIQANQNNLDDVIYEANQDICLGYTDLKVEETGREIIEDQEYVIVDVENTSKVDAEEINLKVLADEEEGQMILDKFIGNLKAGESKSVYIPMDKLEEVDIAYLRLTCQTEEMHTLDNKGILALSDEIYEVAQEVNFSAESEDPAKGQVTYTNTGGEENQEASFRSGDVVNLKATPSGGYVFTGWEEKIEGNRTGTFTNQNSATTDYVLPNKDVTLIAHFESANHGTGISESDNTQIQAFVGERISLTPTITTESGTSTDYIRWDTSDQAVATVQNGKVLITGEGEADITATLIQRTGEGETTTNHVITYQISAKKPQIESIMLPSEPITLKGIGDKASLGDELFITPFNGEGTIKWESSNDSVATVSSKGEVTAAGKGTTTITATVEGHEEITASCEIHVVIPINGVVLNETSLLMERGDTRTLTATVVPEDHSETEVTYSWESLDESVATVAANGNQATIQAVDGGTATIVVKVGENITTYCHVTVENHARSIQISESNLTLNRFASYQLSYTIDPEIVDDDIYWYSSNEDVAIVDEWGGQVEAVNAGTAIITVETSNGKSDQCRVTVNPYGDIMKIPDGTEIVQVSNWSQLESEHNYKDNLSKMWVYHEDMAKSIKIHFNELSETEERFDYLYVLDGQNRVIEKYTGESYEVLTPSNKTVTVQGDTVKIYLKTDGSSTRYGFKVDQAEITYNPQSIKNAAVTVANQTYTGKPLTPEVKVVLNGKTLVKNTDYTVAYQNNLNVGTASVVITGKTKYKDSVTATFAISLPPEVVQNQKAANDVINKINTLNGKDPTSVRAARAAYNALTDAQKRLISAEVLKKLTDAEKAIASQPTNPNPKPSEPTNPKPSQPSLKKISRIRLTGISRKIAAGKRIRLYASIAPSNASNKKLKWYSSNRRIATVTQSGIVTMKKKTGGKTVLITAIATDGSRKRASYRIRSMKGVVKKVKLSGVKTLKAGRKTKLKAKITATKGANKTLKWISSNSRYAKVSSSGKVTARKAGKRKRVRITAMATDGSGKKASIIIKIK